MVRRLGPYAIRAFIFHCDKFNPSHWELSARLKVLPLPITPVARVPVAVSSLQTTSMSIAAAVTAARPQAFAQARAGGSLARRSFATTSQPLLSRVTLNTSSPARPSRIIHPRHRRGYAEYAEAIAGPPKKPKRAGFLRWTWRLTKAGAVAGFAYLAFTIYQGRHPNEQFDPDPSKKTLVILGGHRACPPRAVWQMTTSSKANHH